VLSSALLEAQQFTIQTQGGNGTVLERGDIEALSHARLPTGAARAPVTYESVPLEAVLNKTGVELGERLRGKRMALCLLLEAGDGYRVVITLAGEIDPAFRNKQIGLAFLRYGRPLDAEEAHIEPSSRTRRGWPARWRR
jgi:hypothetical protein